jgi:negative regulator of flagellin synthesis FlgM
MKIWGNIPKVSGVYGNSGKINQPARVGEVTAKRDEFSISGTAKDFTSVMRILKEIPDIRQDRVNEIKQKIESGQYSVRASDVAGKIVQSLETKKI